MPWQRRLEVASWQQDRARSFVMAGTPEGLFRVVYRFENEQLLEIQNRTVPEKPDKEKHNHALLLGLLRTINTAEVADFSKYDSYASWQTLLTHQPEYLNGWLARFYSQEANVHFGDLPEILPGWSLRFNLRADGRGYDVRLQDLTDKTCWYAALTDESGVIRQSKAIDCKI
jgi:hypothetical protein